MPRRHVFETYESIERQRTSRHSEYPERVFVRSAPRTEQRLYEERHPHREKHSRGGPSTYKDRSPSPEYGKRLDGNTIYEYNGDEIRRTTKERKDRLAPSDEKPPSREYVHAFVRAMGGDPDLAGKMRRKTSSRPSGFQAIIIENPTTPDKKDPGKRVPVTIPRALATGKVSIGEYRNGNKFFFRKSTKRGKKPPTAKEASSSGSSNS